jgi:hypothetical protein
MPSPPPLRSAGSNRGLLPPAAKPDRSDIYAYLVRTDRRLGQHKEALFSEPRIPIVLGPLTGLLAALRPIRAGDRASKRSRGWCRYGPPPEIPLHFRT